MGTPKEQARMALDGSPLRTSIHLDSVAPIVGFCASLRAQERAPSGAFREE